MKRILIPTLGPSDWRRLLADPDTQWQRKASAFELAVSWESAEHSERGLPKEVAQALDQEPVLADARTLIALPEHKVMLRGRGKPLQSDVWALLLSGSGYVSMAVEGKAREPFASPLTDWLKEASEGKKERLKFLCKTLQVSDQPPLHLRYQLFHRTASAVLEVQRYRAPLAVMMVQSFKIDEESWRDYAAFATLLGATPTRGGVAKAIRKGSVRLFLGWVDCALALDSLVVNAA
ncbi:MAG TPA: hypothetical protein VFB20_03935 [Burkholderiales bacterium]|nr:hypothetical protein [Burkholderiales bacterium]